MALLPDGQLPQESSEITETLIPLAAQAHARSRQLPQESSEITETLDIARAETMRSDVSSPKNRQRLLKRVINRAALPDTPSAPPRIVRDY